MAMTLVELQAFIDSKPDTRNIVNEIADYLQANPGGGGVTLYSGDAPLASDRTVDLNGKILIFDQGGNPFLKLDPTPTAENMILQSYNVTNGNGAGVRGQTSDGDANAYLEASNFSVGFESASIVVSAAAASSEVVYTADTHTFTGRIINTALIADDFANDGAAAVGGIAVGGYYHTAGAVKVRLS